MYRSAVNLNSSAKWSHLWETDKINSETWIWLYGEFNYTTAMKVCHEIRYVNLNTKFNNKLFFFF
jgi:hypothetical protein